MRLRTAGVSRHYKGELGKTQCNVHDSVQRTRSLRGTRFVEVDGEQSADRAFLDLISGSGAERPQRSRRYWLADHLGDPAAGCQPGPAMRRSQPRARCLARKRG